MKREIKELEIEYLGIKHAQYFGGISLPNWAKDKAIGIGYTAYDALEDALDNLAQQGWDVCDIENQLPRTNSMKEERLLTRNEELSHHVAVYVA